jgi:hypothetical protein
MAVKPNAHGTNNSRRELSFMVEIVPRTQGCWVGIAALRCVHALARRREAADERKDARAS